MSERIRAALIDPWDTTGSDAFLSARQWRPHESFAGLWNRDGGQYESTERALEIEREEQKARDFVKAARAAGSDEPLIRKEIAERRARELDRVGSGRVPTREYNAQGNWGIAKDPAVAAERSRVK